MRATLPGAAWWRRHAGVRLTTSLAAAAVVAAALSVAGLLLVVLLERSLSSGIKDTALQRARDIAATVARDGVEAVGPLTGSTDHSIVQIVADGRVVASSPDVDGELALSRLRPSPGQVRTVTRQGSAGDDDAQLLVALGVTAPDRTNLVVIAARSLEPVQTSTQALRSLLLVGVPLLVLLVGGATFVLAGRALRPVEAIRRRVADIDGDQLGQRVPVPSARDEVGRLAETMNDMLVRLESSASAQRRFVSDASHELRSPLATVRTSMEVAQIHPEITDWTGLTHIVLDETARMQTLVADMLLLARSDERGLQLRRAEVDLDDLCEQAADRLRRAGVRVVTDVQAVRVLGDPDRLARVLRNLTDNAARHASSFVTLRLHAEADGAVLDVLDDGPGIPFAQRERVFERFVRLDESRTRSSGGTGLGLAIVAQIVKVHLGTVTIADAADGGALVRVSLPLPVST